MAIWDFFVSKTQDWYYDKLPAIQTPGDIPDEIIAPQSGYLHIFLKSMRLVNDRVGFSTFYPAVHSFISIPHRRGANAEFNMITAPKNLGELDAQRLNRVIDLNHRLLGPIPYVGGDLSLEVGLFSIKSGNLAKPFLDVLGEMSETAGVSYISMALPFLKPLEKGVDCLIAGKDSNLEIGLAKTYTRLEAGYYVVMRAPRNFQPGTLRVGDKDFKLFYANGEPVEEYPYMVLQIYSTPKREDWFMIPDVVGAYQELQKSMETGAFDNTKALLNNFKRVVLTSMDLLLPHAKVIIGTVEEQVSQILALAGDEADDLVRAGHDQKEVRRDNMRAAVQYTLPSLEQIKVDF